MIVYARDQSGAIHYFDHAGRVDGPARRAEVSMSAEGFFEALHMMPRSMAACAVQDTSGLTVPGEMKVPACKILRLLEGKTRIMMADMRESHSETIWVIDHVEVLQSTGKTETSVGFVALKLVGV